MKTQNGFTLIQGRKDAKEFLNSKKITREINKIQIHHMSMPDYKIWEETDKKKFDEPHFGRTNSLNDYGKTTWDSKDENGKYIAQHFSVFPDGCITSGRSLNDKPIGISGWNTGAICIEIYGNFDKGKDEMTPEQKEAVIMLVGESCMKFNIKPSDNSIRYHGWFTSEGTYLGDYNSAKSRKSCPGTNFFGGNTMAAYKKNFLPAINEYINPAPVKNTINNVAPMVDKKVKVTTYLLNIRQKPSLDSKKVGEVKKDEVFTITKIIGEWGCLKSGAGWINLKYTEKI